MINSAIPDHEKDKGFVEEIDKPLGKGRGERLTGSTRTEDTGGMRVFTTSNGRRHVTGEDAGKWEKGATLNFRKSFPPIRS